MSFCGFARMYGGAWPNIYVQSTTTQGLAGMNALGVSFGSDFFVCVCVFFCRWWLELATYDTSISTSIDSFPPRSTIDLSYCSFHPFPSLIRQTSRHQTNGSRDLEVASPASKTATAITCAPVRCSRYAFMERRINCRCLTIEHACMHPFRENGT